MDGLDAAFDQARQTYEAALLQVDARHKATAAHDHLRKLSLNGGYANLPKEAQDDWQWHSRNQTGFDRLPFELQREDVLAITGPRGPDGRLALREAGFILLDWLASTGQRITATKADGTRRDSHAVAFLMLQLPRFDRTLVAEEVIRNAAYTIAQAYRRKNVRRK